MPDPAGGGLRELGWFVAIDKDEKTPYITAIMIEDVRGRW